MLDARERALRMIQDCNEPDKLRRKATNARRLADAEVEQAASLKLYIVLPATDLGTLEHDVWRSIHALEDVLKSERGRTTMLERTRQKIDRVGEQRTVADLVQGDASTGFQMLMERNMADHTFEAVVLRHPERAFSMGHLRGGMKMWDGI